MKQYTVTWTIELDADNAIDAAKKALEIQRDPSSLAQYFRCYEHNECGKTARYEEVDLQDHS